MTDPVFDHEKLDVDRNIDYEHEHEWRQRHLAIRARTQRLPAGAGWLPPGVCVSGG